MSDFWEKAIKIVGLPGLVLYLIYSLIDKIFDDKITEYLGKDRLYTIIIILIVVLSAFFFYSTFKNPKSQIKEEELSDSKTTHSTENVLTTPKTVNKVQRVEYKDKAKHEGDNNFS
ncbi:TPA: hypothetical protein ACXP5Z_004938 [Klebsiella pneumoniae]